MNKLAIAILALAIGAGIGYFASHMKPKQVNQPAAMARKPLYYRSPMNPEITSPVPAKDNMGMDYVPVYADGNKGEASPGEVRIDPTVVQDIGVRTEKARHETLTRDIRTVGRVTYDEDRLVRLHPKYSGWVDKVYAGKTGQQVNRGDALLAIYSPQLVSSQQEYLLALDNASDLHASPFADVKKSAASLLESSRNRLSLFDMPEWQIDKLQRGGKVMKDVILDSPISGIVTAIGAREGDKIGPETELYAIADLSRIWVLADLYENDMPWVAKGDAVSIELADIPGRKFEGRVDYIYPYLDTKARTIKVRIELDNPQLLLKPDMYANADIHSDKQVDAVTIPSNAVMRTGTRNLVFIQKSRGRFEPKEVELGISSNGRIQILKGVKEGDDVVTSAQFLIDSESKIREAAARMATGKHDTMNMGTAK
jgi:Cu(I)/Ag(I) efflux system membrane fusion protein